MTASSRKEDGLTRERVLDLLYALQTFNDADSTLMRALCDHWLAAHQQSHVELVKPDVMNHEAQRDATNNCATPPPAAARGFVYSSSLYGLGCSWHCRGCSSSSSGTCDGCTPHDPLLLPPPPAALSPPPEVKK